MYTEQIRLGNTVFSFESTMPLKLGGNLPKFQTVGEPANYTVSVRYAQPGEETPHAHGYGWIHREGSRISLALSRKITLEPTVWQILSMLPLSRLLMERGTLLLHASCVLHRGQAILFSGPSGVGKSTQAALWSRFRGTQVVNGDRVLLTPAADGSVVGSHYLCGTSGICDNVTAPVKAIVLLEQAKENRVDAAAPLRSFRLLLSQLDYDVHDRSQLAAVTALVERLMTNTPVLRYGCRMDESAVECLERYLYEEHDPQAHP